MAGRSIGVLGGGVGGLVAANMLRKLLSDRSHSVVLIDRCPDHYFPPAYLWALTGARSLPRLHKPFASLKRKGIEVVTGEITLVRPTHHAVTVGDTRMEFDCLIIALGADIALDATPGLDQCHNFYTFDGIRRLRAALAAFKGGPILIVVADTPFKYSAAAYEAAFLLDDLLRRRGLRPESPIELVTVESEPLHASGTSVSRTMARMLVDRNISLTTGLKLLAVDESRRLATFSDTSQKPFELLIAAPQVRAPSVVLNSGLASETGWISAGPATLGTMFEGIFATGDVASIRLPSSKYLPKAGLFAVQQAAVAAANAVDVVRGRTPQHRFSGHGTLFLETGRGQAARASGDFYAEPEPRVKLANPTRRAHWLKVWSEVRWWQNWL